MFDKSYKHQLDAKNRMRIPAKLRETLGDNYTITIGSGGCLMVLSEEEGAKLKAELKEVSVFDEKAQQTVRAMTYFTWEAEEDKQGRILLPAELRQYAKIEKDVIVIKTPSCIEIWAKEVWEKYIAELNFTYLADAISNISKK